MAVTATPAEAARGLVAPASKCKNQDGYSDEAASRKSMVCLTNYARKKKGLKRYKVRSMLTRSATKKAADIVRCKDFSHTACRREFTYWFEKLGYTDSPGWSAGENIAWGSGSFGNSRSIFRAWLKSPGHRAAILSRDYREIGIGVANGKLEGDLGARVWVQHFGRRG
ncbi:MAG: CAP domain-containing protein [Solirubrobacterales bacterium]